MGLSDRELQKLKKKTYALMCQDRQRLLVRFPFTGGFLMRLEFVPVRDKRLRTAATDGDRIYFDIAFCSKLNADERLFVMAHETWHCVLMHMLRRQTRDQQAFNIATDMEVNRMLAKEGLKSPDCALMPKAEWENLSAEEIYEHLLKQSPQAESEQFDKHLYPGQSDESQSAPAQSSAPSAGEKSHATLPPPSASSALSVGGNSTVTDQWGEVGFDKDFAPTITKDLAEKTRERVVAVAQQMERTRGELPAHLESVVKAAMQPQIRWQEVLAQFVTSCYGGSRRWLPPNRRHIGRGIYLQSSRKERLNAVVAIDTSGSTTADLPQFFTELNSLLNSFGDYELTVIQCDSAVQHVETFDGYNPFHSPEWETYGQGGTDFRPPFDYVAEHSEIEPSCFIYITDGCGPAPDRPPPYPVLWLLTGDGAKPAPWGWELRLK